MHVQNPRPSYCGQRILIAFTPMFSNRSILLQRRLYESTLTVILFKSHLIKHLVQRSICVRLTGSANNERAKYEGLKKDSFLIKKKTRFLTESRVSQQKAGSFCGNLYQNLAEEFRNISANEETINQKRLRNNLRKSFLRVSGRTVIHTCNTAIKGTKLTLCRPCLYRSEETAGQTIGACIF